MTTSWDEYEEKVKIQMKNTYSDTVIEHALTPKNVGDLPGADVNVSMVGACGDNMEMWLKVEQKRVREISFWTDGCEATIACGSITTEMAKGKTLGEAMAIGADKIIKELGGLPPDHTHCAGLASLTLKKTLLEYLNNEKEPWKKNYKKAMGK